MRTPYTPAGAQQKPPHPPPAQKHLTHHPARRPPPPATPLPLLAQDVRALLDVNDDLFQGGEEVYGELAGPRDA